VHDEPISGETPLDQIILTLRTAQITPGSIKGEVLDRYCEELLHRFEPLIRRYWRGVKGIEDYDDFSSVVVLKLFRNLKHLRDPRAFPGYFERVIASATADLLKQTLRLGKQESLDYLDRVYFLPDHLMTGVYVQSHFHRLSQGERLVLELEFIHGLSHGDIQKKTGMPRGTLSSHRSRGINKLKKIIHEDALSLKTIPPPHAANPGGSRS